MAEILTNTFKQGVVLFEFILAFAAIVLCVACTETAEIVSINPLIPQSWGTR